MNRDDLAAITKDDQSSVSPRSDIGNSIEASCSSSSVAPSSIDNIDVSQLQRKISKKNKKIKVLTEQAVTLKVQAEDALQKALGLEMEQRQFFEDVEEMKAQFDKLADNHKKLLWEYLPARDPDMRAIPRIAGHLPETPTVIGTYPLEQVLGYGQYAVVYSSSSPEHPHLAIKAIDKQKLVDLVSLHRVSSEISSLGDPAIRHAGILELLDVIHTKKHIYLVTERGGKDLFEAFGAHTDGLAEETIRPLILHVAEAVDVLHRHNYCHRDLKPENVLYSPENEGGGSGHLVKLIDFGLCTKAVTEQDCVLRDFCGSPGFFAPEMLLRENYDGFKADVWSLGCILLEVRKLPTCACAVVLEEDTDGRCVLLIVNYMQLVLGNALFSSLWMSMYELPILRDPKKFAECVRAEWKYSAKLRSTLLGMLCENPSERLSIRQLLQHPWLAVELLSLPDSPSPSPSSCLRRPSPIKMGSMPESIGLSVANSARIPPDTEMTGAHTNATISVLPLSTMATHHPPASASSQDTPRGLLHLHSPSIGSMPNVKLPSLSPEKASGKRSPERLVAKGSPEKLAFGMGRV
ncbi:hypothetical protein BBJ28_00002401 [Nothophytophthora sp. Chile5]|nr:hypothetical protein BBJ28_00002401 [Nothophytophthora sp. Chile5]